MYKKQIGVALSVLLIVAGSLLAQPGTSFLKSEAATIKLGVWDKFGTGRPYVATFTVTASNGKQSRVQRQVPANEGWVYVDFPNDFTGDAASYSTFSTYSWKCFVSGKEIASGQFQWGNQKSGTDPMIETSEQPVAKNDPTAVSWRKMPIVEGKAVSKSDTTIFGEHYADSIFLPDEAVTFRTAKRFRTLVLMVGIEDNAEALGRKRVEIKNENGVIRNYEAFPNRRPLSITVDISDSDTVTLSNVDLNGQPRDFFRYVNVYFFPK
jgi:hypothetical protein